MSWCKPKPQSGRQTPERLTQTLGEMAELFFGSARFYLDRFSLHLFGRADGMLLLLQLVRWFRVQAATDGGHDSQQRKHKAKGPDASTATRTEWQGAAATLFELLAV